MLPKSVDHPHAVGDQIGAMSGQHRQLADQVVVLAEPRTCPDLREDEAVGELSELREEIPERLVQLHVLSVSAPAGDAAARGRFVH